MEKGTIVMRKSDRKKGIPIFGTVICPLPCDRVRVQWRFVKSDVKCASLLVATPELQAEVREEAQRLQLKQRIARLKECEWVCTNINPLARISNDGHKALFPLLPGQVKDGKCLYCGAEVFKRCENCENPALPNSLLCQECKEA